MCMYKYGEWEKIAEIIWFHDMDTSHMSKNFIIVGWCYETESQANIHTISHEKCLPSLFVFHCVCIYVCVSLCVFFGIWFAHEQLFEIRLVQFSERMVDFECDVMIAWNNKWVFSYPLHKFNESKHLIEFQPATDYRSYCNRTFISLVRTSFISISVRCWLTQRTSRIFVVHIPWDWIRVQSETDYTIIGSKTESMNRFEGKILISLEWSTVNYNILILRIFTLSHVVALKMLYILKDIGVSFLSRI